MDQDRRRCRRPQGHPAFRQRIVEVGVDEDEEVTVTVGVDGPRQRVGVGHLVDDVAPRIGQHQPLGFVVEMAGELPEGRLFEALL